MKFDSFEDKDILDPALGAGGLIAATIIAGADPKSYDAFPTDEK